MSFLHFPGKTHKLKISAVFFMTVALLLFSLNANVSASNTVAGDQTKPTGQKCPEGYVETSYKINDAICLGIHKDSTNPNDNPIFSLLTTFMKFFSALVGVAVTAGIIYGGILWSTSKGNPAQVQKATAVISNAVLGLLLYILMFAIINFLVPGGLFA